MQEAKKALRKACTPPVGFDGKATIAVVTIIASVLYVVEMADISLKLKGGQH